MQFRGNQGAQQQPRSSGTLPAAAIALRVAHAVIAIGFLLAIAYVWRSALTGRHDRRLRVAIVALVGEGALVVANRGDCPLAGLQKRLGDPTPLFELVLSPKAARLAVPVLGAIAGAGVVAAVNGATRAAAASPLGTPRR